MVNWLHDTRQRTVNPQMTVVVGYEAKLLELVHELTDARSCRSDDLGQRFPVDLHRDWLQHCFLADVRKNEKRSREAAFARIEKLIDQPLSCRDGTRP